MHGIGEQLVARRLLDDAAGIHHRDAVAILRDDAEVVADQHHGHAELAADRGEQLQDLCLNGGIERSGRLVRDQEIGIPGQRHRDHDALDLAAGEFVRIGLEPAASVGNADEIKQPPRLRLHGVALEIAMQRQRFAKLPADGQHRVERARRILEDHGDAPAPDLIELGGRRAENLAPVEPHRARDLRMARQQPQRGEPGHRFAGAGLADEADGLALLQGNVDAAQDRHAIEADAQVLDADQRLHLQTSKLPARKSIAKAGAAFHLIDFGLAVKVAFWCSTV
ncbi:hypothetical protein GA0061099_1005182 [Bradyrhizobium yuanmingense]|uniref:Uncharacterized protein n=1 Tax=Bradyrhizobium yuanmingense TaxID=108015 RepID=A0A1C3W346_9BRAD|nr:hypothetical protein IQ15_03142 [Bradyrhizobium yuanmingense]SCB34453.1 hypothetical protein GA0061099_1005182 [Bradyrhizobium yuanmingense]